MQNFKTANIFSLILICLSIGSLKAQNCKYSKDEIDPFSGNKKRIIWQKIKYDEFVTLPPYLGLKYKMADDSFSIIPNIEVFGEYNNKVAAGNNVLLKLQNDKVLKLQSKDDAFPRIRRNGYYGTLTGYVLICDISREGMEQISKSPITSIRVFLEDKYYDFDLKGKKSAKTRRNAACILAD